MAIGASTTIQVPTTGYNHLTLQSVGLYWELTHDPDALTEPCGGRRRSTRTFTFLDGTPVDVINDRNRHWAVRPGRILLFRIFRMAAATSSF